MTTAPFALNSGSMDPHFLSLLLISYLLVLTQAQLSSDTLSLLEFKKGIADDPTGVVRTTWNPVAWGSASAVDSCPRSWHGVSCDDFGEVITVALNGLGLSGELKFSTIVGMRSLRNLSLAGNFFTGRLVPAIGAMPSLQVLDLSNNGFYGPVPEKITNLWGLVHLNLSLNGFRGGFPAGLHNLQQLRVLDLRSNALWADVGAVLSELRNAEHVDLSSNEFYGGLFMDSTNLSSLANTVKYMNLSSNRLSGRFFSNDSMRLFRNLEVLDLGQNKLTGELPSFGSQSNLKVLRVSNNMLYGPITEDLVGSSMELTELDLSRNRFTGNIQNVSFTTLKSLNLSSNSLTGQLPSTIGGCKLLDLSKNKLSGNLIVMQNWGNTLEIIKLGSNELAGSLPSALGSYPKLSTVDLSLNRLTGPVLPTLFTSPTLTSLNLSGNQLDGPIPLRTSQSTESLLVSSYNHLQILDLSNNSLSGSLPTEIGAMAGLGILNLGKNSLSGKLPVEISKLHELEVLDLSLNRFNGGIPDMPGLDLKVFNVSYNDLSGEIPRSLLRFPASSFHPGNAFLVFPNHLDMAKNGSGVVGNMSRRDRSKVGIRIAVIVGSIGAVMLIFFMLVAFYRIKSQESCIEAGLGGEATAGRGAMDMFGRPNRSSASKDDPLPTSTSLSNDHELTSASQSPRAPGDLLTETVEPSSSLLDVDSADMLTGDLFLLDRSLTFTLEELSRAPAEVLGRSSHGISYKATLDNGHILVVKLLLVGHVKQKKDFAKEAKRIGTIRHPNIISWRGYYWGPREQERSIISNYIHGDSLSLYLYDSTPRRLSVHHRLQVAVDVAWCLRHLHHARGLPHGNLKPSNILLTGPIIAANLTDCGLHRLLTPDGIAQQALNLGALGYRAPELSADRPEPSFKADVYSFGVILMEMLTRKSAGDIISGHPGAVDLADWVQMCAREGRQTDVFDRDTAGLEEAPTVMAELLAVSLKCILPVHERPEIDAIYEDLISIT